MFNDDLFDGGLTDLDLEDNVYYTDSEFDEQPSNHHRKQAAAVSHTARCWTTVTAKTGSRLIATRRDSGIGSISSADDVGLSTSPTGRTTNEWTTYDRQNSSVSSADSNDNAVSGSGVVSSNLNRVRRNVPCMGTRAVTLRRIQFDSEQSSTQNQLSYLSPSEQRHSGIVPSNDVADKASTTSVGQSPAAAATADDDEETSAPSASGVTVNDDAVVVNDTRWVVRRRSDGSRYVCRTSKSEKLHPRRHSQNDSRHVRRRHRLPSNENYDVIEQWRHLASRLFNAGDAEDSNSLLGHVLDASNDSVFTDHVTDYAGKHDIQLKLILAVV